MTPPRVAGILAHGRGGSSADMLGLADHLAVPGVSWRAPQAPGGAWYPQRFLAPLESNEPWLSRALATLDAEVKRAADEGIPREHLALVGFSQGACLILEYVARRGGRWGAVIALTGGLIGPEGLPRHYDGDLDGTPVFLGTSDPDPHVPVARAEETAAVLERMGARMDLRVYPDLGHTVNEDEVEAARVLLRAIGRPG